MGSAKINPEQQVAQPVPPDGWGDRNAYAAHRKARGLTGGTRQGVQKAVNSQRIPHPNQHGWFHFQTCDEAWARNTDTRYVAGKDIPAEPPVAQGSQRPAAVQDPALGPPAAESYNSLRDRKLFFEAQKLEAEAGLKQAELDIKRGNLLDADQARQALGDFMTTLRQRLEAVINPLADEVAGIDDAKLAADKIERRIHGALLELPNSNPLAAPAGT